MPQCKLILMAHGSRDARWRMPFEVLISSLKEEIGQEKIDLAYMEFCSPSLEQVIESSYKDGVRSIKILPLFMAGGAHLNDDVPKILESIAGTYDSLEITMLRPIGEHQEIIKALKSIVTSNTLQLSSK